jgi:hypothetical protein
MKILSLTLVGVFGVVSAHAGTGHTTVHTGGNNHGSYHGGYHGGHGYYAHGATAAVIGTAAITTVTITTAAITPTTRPSSEDSRFQFRSPSQVSKHFAVNE